MPNLVSNPKDRFSHVKGRIILVYDTITSKPLKTLVTIFYYVSTGGGGDEA